jgi:hypothetical protein
LDCGGILALVLHEILGVVLDADTALLVTALRPVIQENRAVIVYRNLGGAEEWPGGGYSVPAWSFVMYTVLRLNLVNAVIQLES